MNFKRLSAADVAWIIVKIAWAIYCLFNLSKSCPIYSDTNAFMDFGLLCLVLFSWFAAGFLFCLLQKKYQNLKWKIAMHIFLTSMFFMPYSPFYSILMNLLS